MVEICKVEQIPFYLVQILKNTNKIPNKVHRRKLLGEAYKQK